MRHYCIAAILLFVSGCATTYEPFIIENFADRTAHHEVVAILPFSITTMEGLEETVEQAESHAAQQELYDALLRHFSQAESTVRLQPVEETNSLLQRSNVSWAELHNSESSISKHELCGLLDVHAVVSGHILFLDASVPSNTRVMEARSSGASGSDILSGITRGDFDESATRVWVTAEIHGDGGDSELWRFSKQRVTRGSPAETRREFFAGIASTFPYVERGNEKAEP